MDLFEAVSQACRDAMAAAADSPGRYGGRYVARTLDGEGLVICDDDPETVPDDLDVIAQCTPDVVHPIGRAQQWLREDGSVIF